MRTTEQTTRELLAKMKLVTGNNHILVRVKSNEGRTTEAGVIVGFNADIGSNVLDVYIYYNKRYMGA